MLQTTYKIILILLFLSVAEGKKPTEPVKLRQNFKELFSHKDHKKPFADAKVSCTDCHSFSVKTTDPDPLAAGVPAHYSMANRKVCHECHLGPVELPRVNQCTLCHLNPEKLQPPNHFSNIWKKKHGHSAQVDPESCNTCHSDNQNSCLNCHTQRNSIKPMVHRPNFRLTHSIEARANPAKCASCHTNTSSCLQCHKGGFK